MQAGACIVGYHVAMDSLKDIEDRPAGSTHARAEVFAVLRFSAGGLLPVIAQQHDTGDVLMLAWMNRDALEETIASGRVCYWSRSRGELWRKGETSGQVQHLIEMRIDCDGDALLLLVDQHGPACHTGRRSCFFHRVEGDTVTVMNAPLIDPDTLYPGDPADR